MEPEKQNINSKQKINYKTLLLIFLLAAILAIIYTSLRINYLQQQLINQEFQLSTLQNSKDILARKLEETNLKLVALDSANKFLEKNNEQLIVMRDFLHSQLNMLNKQLASQQEIISFQQQIIASLNEANSKLDTVISQIGNLYLQSTTTSTSKGPKGKVDVILSPAEEK